MKIFPLSQAPTRMQALFFREGRLSHVILFACSVTALTAIIWGFCQYKLPTLALLLGGGMLALVTWITSYCLYQSCLPTNWVLAIGPDTLWIKYRSFLNSRLPSEDLQLVALSFSEIESAVDIRRTEYAIVSRNRTQTTFLRFLELALRQPVGEELKNALKTERQKQRWQACPLSVVGPAALRISIKGIRPGRKKLLEQLAQNGITVAPEKREVEDYTKPLRDKRLMEEQILGLAEQGRKIEAVKLARRRYGINLTDAKQFVDELSR